MGNIIGVDDQRFFLNELKIDFEILKLEHYLYCGASKFEECVSKEILENSDYIFLDYELGTCTVVERKVTLFIRNLAPGFKGKIILMSLHSEFGKDSKFIESEFDSVVSKENLNRDYFRKLM